MINFYAIHNDTRDKLIVLNLESLVLFKNIHQIRVNNVSSCCCRSSNRCKSWEKNDKHMSTDFKHEKAVLIIK